jgi:FlaG/FlaF family flagellin (archaellin)
MKVISVIAVIAVSLALGGCFASVINAYSVSGQDPTYKGNEVLTKGPANVPVQPQGGG